MLEVSQVFYKRGEMATGRGLDCPANQHIASKLGTHVDCTQKHTAGACASIHRFLSVVQGCNFAHVLGLYRMSDEAGQAFYLRSRGALADMLLWAIFRLQTRVFASNTYIKCAPSPQLRSCEAAAPGVHAQPLCPVHPLSALWGLLI